MGREVRKVPANWEHPRGETGRHRPLGEPDAPIEELQAEYDRQAAEWYSSGEAAEHDCSFEEWEGQRPSSDNCMPWWPEEERTHWQMYETTSAGTPISPPMESPEALARWLADTGASSFASMTATYEQWLATIKQRSAVSMVMAGGQMYSGVAFAGSVATEPADNVAEHDDRTGHGTRDSE